MFRQWSWIVVMVLMGAPLWAQQDQHKNFEVEYTETVSERRVALVIGNAAYSRRPLSNPVNDADSMAAALTACGFTVLRYKNLKYRGMINAVSAFGDSIEHGGVGLFYYSGHGIQVDGKNYLVPVNADSTVDKVKEDVVQYVCLDMQLVLGKMEKAGNRVNILILDACRDNPFESQYKSSGSSGGLVGISKAPKGTFIAYATAENEVAHDGRGPNSPFTEALVKEMRKKGFTIEAVFRKVTESVFNKTKRRQKPWTASSLMGKPFYFVLPDGTEPIDQPNPGSGIITQAQEQWRRARLAERERVVARMFADTVNPISANAQQLAKEKQEFSLFTGRQPSSKHVNDNGKTDLHIAVMLKLAVLTKFLVLHEAEINAKDKNGNTPLHVAATIDAIGVAKVLLNHDAKISVLNNCNVTPLGIAVDHKASKVEGLLKKKGATKLRKRRKKAIYESYW